MEHHEYSWSAMSGSTVLPPGAVASGSSHTFVAVFGLSGLLVAHRFIKMSSMIVEVPMQQIAKETVGGGESGPA